MENESDQMVVFMHIKRRTLKREIFLYLFLKEVGLEQRILTGQSFWKISDKNKEALRRKLIFQIVKSVNKQPREICEESFMGDVKEDKQPLSLASPRSPSTTSNWIN